MLTIFLYSCVFWFGNKKPGTWTPMQIAAFMHTWAAHKKARLDGYAEKLATSEQEALAKLGDEPRPYILPLNILAAKISA